MYTNDEQQVLVTSHKHSSSSLTSNNMPLTQSAKSPKLQTLDTNNINKNRPSVPWNHMVNSFVVRPHKDEQSSKDLASSKRIKRDSHINNQNPNQNTFIKSQYFT